MFRRVTELSRRIHRLFPSPTSHWCLADGLSQLFIHTGQKNHYDTLGITPKASQEDVKSAYFKLSKRYHPDVNVDKDAVVKFRELTDAYEVLGNVDSRREYDRGFGLSDRTATRANRSPTTPPFTGHSHIYNYDEWTRYHYGDELFRGDQKKPKPAQQSVSDDDMKDDDVADRSFEIRVLTVLATVLTVLYIVELYTAPEPDAPPTPTEQKNE